MLIEHNMTKLNDVNTKDIVDAVTLACQTMSRCFDRNDNDIPFFGANVRPVAEMKFSSVHSEAHVPGRHLNALLNAEDALNIRISEDAVEKHTRAAFFSYSGPVALPLNRKVVGGPLINFLSHNIREGFHALYALIKYRESAKARELAEASIDAIFDLWDPETGWDQPRLEGEYGLTMLPERTFISGIARAIGPLVKYYRFTGYGPALDLAIVLKEKAIVEVFDEEGTFDLDRFGTHNHSTTCVMSSLAQFADLTKDSNLLHRTKKFFDNGLWDIRDKIGYNIESAHTGGDNTGRGEVNNTGDILETALIFGRWGYPEYYHDAERILRGHLLPSQLRDVSFVEDPDNPEGLDGRHNVAERLRGAWGFPAPYGHEPIGLVGSDNYRVGFNLDIVGGTVGSLCEAYREATRFDESGHWVNLLFDHETPYIEVGSPYANSSLQVRIKHPAPLWVRVPPWVDLGKIDVAGLSGTYRHTNGYLFFPEPPINRTLSIKLPLVEQEITLRNIAGPIRTRLRGDEVVAMESFGADLTFFDPIE